MKKLKIRFLLVSALHIGICVYRQFGSPGNYSKDGAFQSDDENYENSVTAYSEARYSRFILSRTHYQYISTAS